MEWNLDKKKAICPQLVEGLCRVIASGEFSAGSKLPSVREIAVSAAVNPNTVQKAFEGLEEMGIVISQRGSGWYVSENTEIAASKTRKIALEKTKEYIESMKNLGFDNEKIFEIIKECNK